MSRLTSYDEKEKAIIANEEERLLRAKGIINKDEMYKIMMHLAEKLYEYENAEEYDGFIKLPCKIGDYVYIKLASYCDHPYVKAEVINYTHLIGTGFCAVVILDNFSKSKENIPFSEFGKSVFLTEEEVNR